MTSGRPTRRRAACARLRSTSPTLPRYHTRVLQRRPTTLFLHKHTRSLVATDARAARHGQTPPQQPVLLNCKAGRVRRSFTNSARAAHLWGERWPRRRPGPTPPPCVAAARRLPTPAKACTETPSQRSLCLLGPCSRKTA